MVSLLVPFRTTGRDVPAIPHARWGPASLPPVHLNFWDCDLSGTLAEASGFRSLLLLPVRSLVGMTAFHGQPVRFCGIKWGRFFGLREGSHIYAVLTPVK